MKTHFSVLVAAQRIGSAAAAERARLLRNYGTLLAKRACTPRRSRGPLKPVLGRQVMWRPFFDLKQEWNPVRLFLDIHFEGNVIRKIR
jgi:hypothetical protein